MQQEDAYYKKERGTESLKRRFGVVYYFLVIMPLVFYMVVFLYKNNEVKSLGKRIGQLEHEQKILVNKYKSLVSDYSQISSSQNIRDYALNNLQMEPVRNTIETFDVADNNSIFLESTPGDLPILFEQKLDLASSLKPLEGKPLTTTEQ